MTKGFYRKTLPFRVLSAAVAFALTLSMSGIAYAAPGASGNSQQPAAAERAAVTQRAAAPRRAAVTTPRHAAAPDPARADTKPVSTSKPADKPVIDGSVANCLPDGAFSIKGFKWEDKDVDGHQDSGENGVAGFQFHVTGGPAGHIVDLWATSDSHGEFSVGAGKLWNGSYQVTETQRDADGWHVVGSASKTVWVDQADACVSFANYHATVGLTKTVDKPIIVRGESVVYKYKATNTGGTQLLAVTVTDDKIASLPGNYLGALNEGESKSFNSPSQTPTASIHNVATVNGKDKAGRDLTPVTAAADVTVLVPGVSIEKSAEPTHPLPGDPVTYSYKVTNTGQVTLYNLRVTDNKLTGFHPVITSLAPGAFTVVSTTVPVGNDMTNIGTVRADYYGYGKQPGGECSTKLGEVTASDDCTVLVKRPAIALTKTVDKPVIIAGEQVTYTYVVTNTGEHVLTYTLTDDQAGSGWTKTGTIAVGQVLTFTYSATPNADVTNHAKVVGVSARWDAAVQATAQASVHVVHPAIDVEKSASPDVVISGEPLTYTYVVTNIGDVTLNGVTAVDDHLGTVGTAASLAPGAHVTFTHAATLSQTTTNTVTAGGTDAWQHHVTDTDDENVVVVHPSVAITKLAAPVVGLPGTPVTYTYVITNTGDTALFSLAVDDDPLGHIGTITSLAVGGSVTLTKVVSMDVDTTNTVTVVGHDTWEHRVSASAFAHFDAVHPKVGIEKTASPTVVIAGETVTYTYTVTNEGDVPLFGIAVTDDHLGAIGSITRLDPDQSTQLTASTTLTTTTVNVGTARGTDAWQHEVSDTDDARVQLVRPAVTLEKSASPTVGLPNTPVTYTYVVTNSGDTDLFGLTVDDVPLGHIGDIASLAPGATATLTVTRAILVDTVNTAIVMGHDAWQHPVQDEASASFDAIHPSVSLTKVADRIQVNSGATVTYTYTMQNTGDVPLFSLSLDDDMLGHIGSVDSLAPGGTAVLTSSTVLTTDTTNVGTVTGMDALEHPVTASATESVRVVHPNISVVKTPDAPEEGVPVGTLVTYTYTVTNTGDTPLVNVSLVDDKLGTIVTGLSLAIGEARVFTASKVLEESESNTVVATGDDGFGNVVDSSANATVVTFLPFTPPDLAITKTASVSKAGPDDIVTYTLKYRNVSGGSATLFDITDTYDAANMSVYDPAGGDDSVAGTIVWEFEGPLAVEDGWQTLTYKLKVHHSIPEGTTHVDNTAVISVEGDSDQTNNSATARVDISQELPFLPYTGGPYSELQWAALLFAASGVALLEIWRRMRRTA